MKKTIIFFTIFLFFLSGCSNSDEEKIKGIEGKNKILTKQILDYKNELKYARDKYKKLEFEKASRNIEDDALYNKNKELIVSLEKVNFLLKEEKKKRSDLEIKLNSDNKYAYRKKFDQENKELLEGGIIDKYLGYFILLVIISFVSSYFILKYLFEKKYSAQRSQLINENREKDSKIQEKESSILNVKSKLKETITINKHKIKDMEERIIKGSNNKIVEKINEMQHSRESRIASL